MSRIYGGDTGQCHPFELLSSVITVLKKHQINRLTRADSITTSMYHMTLPVELVTHSGVNFAVRKGKKNKQEANYLITEQF